jgi:hypothetical protein
VKPARPVRERLCRSAVLPKYAEPTQVERFGLYPCPLRGWLALQAPQIREEPQSRVKSLVLEHVRRFCLYPCL